MPLVYTDSEDGSIERNGSDVFAEEESGRAFSQMASEIILVSMIIQRALALAACFRRTEYPIVPATRGLRYKTRKRNARNAPEPGMNKAFADAISVS